MREGDVESEALALAGTQYYSDFANHDMSVAAPQAISGVGFRPKAVQFMATKASSVGEMSWGFIAHNDGGSGLGRLIYDNYNGVANTYTHTNNEVIIMLAPTYNIQAEFTSFDVDGFTITWIHIAGSPTGICEFKYLCFK